MKKVTLWFCMAALFISQAHAQAPAKEDHGGNIDGFSALTCLFPTDNIGIIVLSNQAGSIVSGRMVG